MDNNINNQLYIIINTIFGDKMAVFKRKKDYEDIEPKEVFIILENIEMILII